MTDQNSTTPAPDAAVDAEVVVEPTRLQKFVLDHPRASRVIAIIGGVTAIAGVAATTNTMRKNKHHLDSAVDHAKEAGHELSAAVSPTSDPTDA